MKKYTVFSTCFNIIFLFLVVALIIKGNYIGMIKNSLQKESGEYDYTKNASYIQRTTQFDILPADSCDVLFLGDSITARFEWQAYFPQLKVYNRGIDSDVVEGVYNRLDQVIKVHPKKIFIMAGINDIQNKIPDTNTLKYYDEIIQTLKAELPDTEIVIQSILPVNKKTGIDNSEVAGLNEKISELAKANSLTYIDLYSLMIDSENDFTYTVDGVHPTGDGYQIWMDAIEKYVTD